MAEDDAGDDTTGPGEAKPPPGTAVRGEGPGADPTDSLFWLLGNPRRRVVLAHLQRRADETVDVDEVIDAVAARERPDPGPGTHRERVAIDLHHVHLPKLADAGVIEYDPMERTLRYRGRRGLDLLLAASRAIKDEAGRRDAER